MGKAAGPKKFVQIIGSTLKFAATTWEALGPARVMIGKFIGWARTGLDAFRIAKGVIEGKLEQVWEGFRNIARVHLPAISVELTKIEDLFREFDRTVGKEFRVFRDEILSLNKEVKDVLGRDLLDLAYRIEVLDTETAEKIRALHYQIIDYVNVYTRDWIEKIDQDITSVRGDILSKYYELTSVLDERIKPVADLLGKIERLTGATIEKPALLRRETLEGSGTKYGMDFLNATFEATTPRPPPKEEKWPLAGEVGRAIRNMIGLIAMGPAGPFADVERYILEEITEITTGGTLEVRTDVKVPSEEDMLRETTEEEFVIPEAKAPGDIIRKLGIE